MSLLHIDGLCVVASGVRGKNGNDGVKSWSTAVQILLPVAALAILWGRRGFFARFFLQFDKNCVSVLCPSFSKRQRLLKWASGRLPQMWSTQSNAHLAEFWKDGSLLCTLINSAIPGACPNPHRHWRRPPSHGQALAYKYLGVVPIFKESELAGGALTSQQERSLLNYLLDIQQAITKISVPEFKFSSCYVARGMGLVAGEQNRKTSFYIYSNSSSTDNQDAMVSIRGPYNTSCAVTVPARYILRKPFQLRLNERRRLAYQSRAQRSFLRSFSVDLGSFINTGPKQYVEDEIPVKLVTEKERVKVVYIPKVAGIHEVSIITNGCHLTGSPFTINISENTTKVVDVFEESEKSPFRRHDARSIRRRVISKIIDFIDEKVTYGNLRALPAYVKSIPQIRISGAKHNEEELEKEQDNGESSQTHEVKISQVKHDEEELEKAQNNGESSQTHEAFTICETQHQDVAPDDAESIFKENTNEKKISNLNIESEFVDTIFNPSSKEDSLALDTPKDEFDLNLSLIPHSNAKTDETLETTVHTNDINLDNLCDSNNNSPVLKTKAVFPSQDAILSLPNNPEFTGSFLTSPICEHHIEKEVIQKIVDYCSSEIPERNFKKKDSRRQSQVGIPNLVSDPKKALQYKTETQTLQTNEAIVSNNAEEHLKLEEIQYSHPNKNTCEMSTISNGGFENSEILEELFGCQATSTTRNQMNINGSKFPEAKSMHILNYLPSLKTDNPGFSTTAVSEKEFNRGHQAFHHKSSLQLATVTYFNKENISRARSTFKERLQYWEIKTNLNLADKRTKLKQRRSLPNLFTSTGTGLIFFPSIDDSRHASHCNYINYQNNNKQMDNSLFRERQKYWRTVSSQTASNSSLTDCSCYIENATTNFTKNRIKTRHSLPNLFSEVHRHEIYDQSIDFYDSPDSVRFRTRFQECREYWEKLSTHHLNQSGYFKDLNDYHYQDDDNFDSGFCSSLPNLWIKSRQDLSGSLAEDIDSLEFKMRYKERQEYWKRLSNASLNSFCFATGKSTLNGAYLNESFVGNVLNESKSNEIKVATEKEHQSEDAAEEDAVTLNRVADNEETNLTDDLKSIGDLRERMRMQFYLAREFFKSLKNNPN